MIREVRSTFMGKTRTDFMIGIEVEKTPAFSMKTLFVQGFKSFDEICEIGTEQKTEHIYLGANRSFEIGHNWDSLVRKLIEAGFIVTLDYLAEYHPYLIITLSNNVWSDNRFIPMVTFDVSNLCGLSKNLTVKIDDTDFSSPGVWCINCQDIADPKRFTAWGEYSDDEIIR